VTKPKLLVHCDKSPTGSHHRLMEWRDMPNGLREYWGVCKWCGNPKREAVASMREHQERQEKLW